MKAIKTLLLVAATMPCLTHSMKRSPETDFKCEHMVKVLRECQAVIDKEKREDEERREHTRDMEKRLRGIIRRRLDAHKVVKRIVKGDDNG